MHPPFSADPDFARELDAKDPLRRHRERFCIPRRADGSEVRYLTGNSLGLMPRDARRLVDEELDDWERLAGEAHFHGSRPWFPYHELFRDTGARLVGALPGEVVMMNSLTVNLHLLMASFYRPTPDRHCILIEAGAFPSDEYAVASQTRFHGYDPRSAVLRLAPRPGEHTLRTDDVEAFLHREGRRVALVMLAGVNYATGQAFDIPRIAHAAHHAGCAVGVDLAHAAGNLQLHLHDWNVDFAAWCSYKYLNSGPGSLAGAFVHQRHWNGPAAQRRLEGWWGTDPATRFQMKPDFEPALGAEAWQVSNPPILSAAPLKASLDIFDAVGMPALRDKSRTLTGYLRWLLSRPGSRAAEHIRILTPEDPAHHGCQLSLRVRAGAKALRESLVRDGCICDFREPDIIRAAPVPLYNTYSDALAFAQAVERNLA